VSLATAGYAASWFLPAWPAERMPGWSACAMAFMAPWSSGDEPTLGNWPITILAFVSSLTNLLMLVNIVALARRMELRTRWAWSLVAAGLLNTWWIVMFQDYHPLGVKVGAPAEPQGLGAGYHIWWMSFVLAGAGRLAIRSTATSEHPEPAEPTTR